MSAPPQLSAAAGTDKQSRSASKAVLKAVNGFHVFRIEGYSLTKMIPGGERISSQDFTVGGHRWRVDLYPNGTDIAKDESDSVTLCLVYLGEQTGYGDVHQPQPLKRLVAEYKFCLLDHAGDAAYVLPAQKGVFKGSSGCDHDTFISRFELVGQFQRLLKDDCLAIRCDVSVVDQLSLRSIIDTGAKRSRRSRYSGDTTASSGFDDTPTEGSSYSDDSCSDADSDSRSSRRRNKRRHRRGTSWLQDREFALRTVES